MTLISPIVLVQVAALIGSWRGTSTCVDKVKNPACNNEVVIYDVRQHPAFKDSVILAADKVVNGERESMGETTFGMAKDGSWVANVKTPRYQLRITLAIKGDSLNGGLFDMPAGNQVRRLALIRVKPSR